MSLPISQDVPSISTKIPSHLQISSAFFHSQYHTNRTTFDIAINDVLLPSLPSQKKGNTLLTISSTNNHVLLLSLT